MDEEFGPLDWYRAKTVEEMRSDLVAMAKGDYFDDDQEYAFIAEGGLVIRTGAELNDQAPEGPGPEEYQSMDEEGIVKQYISRIKMFPPYVDIEDQEGFAKAFLPSLDNMNNVASYYMTGKGTRDNPMKSEIQYGNGMELASEIQTGAITDYISTGFKSKEEFYEWYLRDVANIQAVLQPGQTQAEDFSIVDEGFYNETPPPNTKFPRRPETKDDSSLFKQEEKAQEDMSFAEKFNQNSANAPVGPVTQRIRDYQPGQNYYKFLKQMTAIGESVVKGTGELLGSAAKGPVEFGKKVKENIEEGLETAKEGPSLLDIVRRLQENPGTMKIEEDTNE